MAKQTLQTIKNWFVRGAKPTQSQFSDTFDSFWHKDEAISQSNVENLGAILTSMQSDIDAAVKIADPSKFMGVSGIASSASQMWCRIARIKIELPSESDYSSYQSKCTFVGSIDVMSQCTNPYSNRDHYMQAAKLLMKIVWRHPRTEAEVELRLNEAVAIDNTQFKLIEITHDIETRTEVLDLYIRTSYIFDRFFYFYKTNVQYSDILTFTAIEAETPIFENNLPVGTGVTFVPTDGTEDKHVAIEFANKTSVSITHTLNKYPSVTIVDEDGYQILADVQYNSISNIQVTFTEAMSGNIYLN